MEKRSIEMIELELAMLVRRLTSMTTYKKIGNLDRAAYLLLHQIAFYGSAGVKALADEFHLDISTVSRQVAALEQKAYIVRVPDPVDGRAFSLQITDLGSEVLEENRLARQDTIGKLLHAWSEEEGAALGQLLQKFNASFEEES
ncbi:MarR family winged helix-turn-helix transcriptional regulator [Paenibacillus sp. HW567]|uniref:MarR family winged helix-turn-helix transcriptional regulator n=1 Tax=Paenibacillus sp. HW567 TaxID=1034769 RepID=UPI0003709492|nr:MarR family transcriptional regulator [Paenibacillus sp. HW567]